MEEGEPRRIRGAEDWQGLAACWPRALLEAGRGEALARWWCASLARARGVGKAPFPRCAPSVPLLEVLAGARRARQLERGLEGAEAALDSEEAGLRRAAATRPGESGRRISRLLVVSADGSPRFYRGVARLCERHGTRLEAVVLECDASQLGESVFGAGRRAQAVLLSHKEAVARFLAALEAACGEASEGPT
ncbi:MAG: hypothetical protein JRG86_16455 [Deltaproteobacteria bacterium]|jgi:hypothetical protein|nr:hypothetical protein [Deltaproteobacteria bacterium]MBW2500724.1 hypothetical protein [Deltaproteobacteria bacterium]